MTQVVEFNKYKSSKTYNDWRRQLLKTIVGFEHPLYHPYIEIYLRSTVEYLHHTNRLNVGALPFGFNVEGRGAEEVIAEFKDGHRALYFQGEEAPVNPDYPIFAHLHVKTMTAAEKEQSLAAFPFTTEDADDAIFGYLQQWQDIEQLDGMSSLTVLPLLITVYVLGDAGFGFKINHIHTGTRNGPHPFLRIQATHHKGVKLEFQYNHETVVKQYSDFRARERIATREQGLFIDRRQR